MFIRAKKSLGQNFLKSGKALSAIIDAGDIHADDIVLEIGPGKGALTEKLLKLAGKVIAVEKDPELVEFLKEKFETEIKEGKLDLQEEDILKFDPKEIPPPAPPNLGGETSDKPRYKIIANIPYYITGAIIRQFLESDFQPELMVLLLQKEVVQRIVARSTGSRQGRDSKESILSISVKAYGEPKYIMKVPAKDFSPAPKVDSGILLIENISKNKFKNLSEKNFFEIVKAGFAQKRKKLLNNLESVFKNKEILIEIFSENELSPNIRAEDLKIGDWINLAQKLSSKLSK
jgi:16S rRNA (adenine1518-N6/adenine1519-N6)-dimethyltransferase